MSAHKDTVKLTVNMSLEQHTYIKMLATAQGISLKQFIIDHLPNLNRGKKKQKDISNEKFDEILKEIMIEHADVLKRLSKK